MYVAVQLTFRSEIFTEHLHFIPSIVFLIELHWHIFCLNVEEPYKHTYYACGLLTFL